MPNRIDDSYQRKTSIKQPEDTDETSETDTTTGVDETEGAGETDGAEGAGSTDAPQTRDVWVRASTPYGDFMDESTPEPGPQTDGVSEDSMAVWEMMGSSEADAVADEESFDINENSATGVIAASFEPLADENLSVREVRSEFDIRVFQDMTPGQRNDLVELAGHSDEFQSRLADHLGDPELAEAVVDEVEQRVLRMAGERIASRARPQIEQGIEGLDNIDSSSESRRAFLATIAETADGPDGIERALSDFGLGSGAAEDIADVLVELQGDDAAMEAFLQGEDGPGEFLILDGDYENAEEELASELDEMRDGLESLQRSLGSNQLGDATFLTDPTVSEIRDEVLADMGANTEPGETNALGEFFIEATEEVESSQMVETVTGAVVGAGAALAAGALSGGVGTGFVIGAAVTGVQSAPELAQAEQDVGRAQGAARADLANPQLVEMAERDEKIAYGVAAASMIAGGIGGAAGGRADGARETLRAGVATEGAIAGTSVAGEGVSNVLSDEE